MWVWVGEAVKGSGTQKILGGVHGLRGAVPSTMPGLVTCATVLAQSKVTCVELRGRAQTHTHMHACAHHAFSRKKPVCLPGPGLALLVKAALLEYNSRAATTTAAGGLDGCAAYSTRRNHAAPVQ